MMRRPSAVSDRVVLSAFVAVACLAATACGRKEKQAEAPQFTTYSGKLMAADLRFARGAYRGHVCLAGPGMNDDCVLTAEPATLTDPSQAVPPKLFEPPLGDGQYHIYTYTSYDAAGAWSPVLATFTIAGGVVTLATNPTVRNNESSNTLELISRPLTVATPGYKAVFTTDWTKMYHLPIAPAAGSPPGTLPRWDFTLNFLVGRRHTLMDVSSHHSDPAVYPYRLGDGMDILISENGDANDISAALKNSFSWDPATRTLTGKVAAIRIDSKGYRGAIGIGNEYLHGPTGPGPGEVGGPNPNTPAIHLLHGRRYMAFDYGSLDIVRRGYNFSAAGDVFISPEGVLSLGLNPPAARGTADHFENLGGGWLRAKVGTLTATFWDGYWYFLGLEFGQGGGTGSGLSTSALLGRSWPFFPDYTYMDFSQAGACSQTTFDSDLWAGTVTLDCKPPAPAAPASPSDVRMACVGQPEGITCDDGIVCTTGDTCDGNGTCRGTRSAGCQDTVPTATCNLPDKPPGQGFTAVFGYSNNTKQNIEIPVGPQNFVDTPNTDRGQPRWFQPGSNPAAFTVRSTGAAVSWQLGAITVSSSTAGNCQSNPPAGTRLVATADGPALEVAGVGGEPPEFFLLFPDEDEIAPGKIIATSPAGAGLEPVAGGLDVSADGAATYNVPLWVPPGRNGMEPSLSLSYNSRGGNGQLGVGWALAGLSRITRCAQNKINSDKFRAVRFDNEDLFCLDGNPLVLAKGTYGAGGSEYRTHKATYSKIKATGTGDARLGPQSFEVLRKNGRKYTYERASGLGITAHVFEAPANYAWLLTKIVDRFNNDIRFSYYPSSFSGATNDKLDIRIKDIRYTGHGTEEGTRVVEFEYSATRTDVIERYVGGVGLVDAKRLTTITMKGPNPSAVSVLRKYSLIYADEDFTHGVSITGRSLLRSIRECDADNVCRPATTFTWEKGSNDFATGSPIAVSDSGGNSISLSDGFTVSDVDLDGRDDLVISRRKTAVEGSTTTSTSVGWARHGAGTGQFTFSGFSVVTDRYSITDPVVLDVNNDGRNEMAIWENYRICGAGQKRCDKECIAETAACNGALNLGRIFASRYRFRDAIDGTETLTTDQASETAFSNPTKLMLAADITGDGAAEIFRRKESVFVNGVETHGDWMFRRGSHAATMAAEYEVFIPGAVLEGETLNLDPMDLDGDGVSEIVVNKRWIVRAPEFRVGGNVLEEIPGMPDAAPTFVDMNGDGLVDALFGFAGDFCPTLCVWLNRGGHFKRSPEWEQRSNDNTTRLWSEERSRRQVDFDGDGAPDVVFLTDPTLFSGQQGHLHVIKSGTTKVIPKADGGVFPQSYFWKPEDGGGEFRGTRFMDVDRDGLQDVVQLEGAAVGQLTLKYYRRLGGKPDVIKTVENGIGRQSSVTYADLASNAVGGSGTEGHYGCGLAVGSSQRCVKRGVHVVTHLTRFLGQEDPINHTYENAIRDTRVGGTGILFRAHARERGGETIRTLYHVGKPTDDYAFEAGSLLAGMPESVRTKNGKLHNLVTNNYEIVRHEYREGDVVVGRSYEVRSKGSEANFRDRLKTDLDDDETDDYDRTTTRTLVYEPGEFGNVKSDTTVVRDAWDTAPSGILQKSEVTTTYKNDAADWLIGFPEDVRTKTFKPGTELSVERESHRTATPWTGTVSLGTETFMPNGGNELKLETIYDRTSYGLVKSTTTNGWSGSETQSRVVETDYDAVDHAFPVLTRNAAGHETETLYHRGYGLLLWSRGPNGGVATTIYDRFGRVRETKLPDGGGSEIRYEGGTAPSAFLQVRTIVKNGPETVVQLDGALRELRTSVKNPGGQWTTTGREYDFLGRVWKVYIPVELPQVSTVIPEGTKASAYFYDSKNRVILSKNPDDTTIGVDYKTEATPSNRPFAVDLRVTTDARDKKTYEYRDLLGRIYESGLGDGVLRRDRRLTFTYAGDGQIETVTDVRETLFPPPGTPGNVTRISYDALGRRKEFTDPNSAKRTTHYNAFGEVRQENIAGESTSTTFVRDKLGRVKTQTDKDGTTTFTWDSVDDGLGSLGQSRSPSGVTSLFAYDAIGRPKSESTYIEGEWFTTSRTYDPTTGKLDQVNYPAIKRTGQPDVTTAVTYKYADSTGALQWIEATGGTTKYLEVLERDELGRVTKERSGDQSVTTRIYDPLNGMLTDIALKTAEGGTTLDDVGYKYDANLNVTERIDKTNLPSEPTERFTYDEQNRLTEWKELAPQVEFRWRVAYGLDVLGNLEARQLFSNLGSNLSNPQNITYTYPATATTRPHAPQSTTGGWVAGSYGYDDARGTQTSRPGGEVVDYTSFDLPTSITKSQKVVAFKYDAMGTRVWKAEKAGQPDEISTKYVGGLYERRRLSAASIDHVFYVRAGGRVVAQLTRTTSDPTSTTVDYLHHDRLGSVTAVTTAGGPAGAQLRGRKKYDPHGNQYDGEPFLTGTFTEVAPGVRLGFTGQEMDSDVGLINMRGRIYDAKTSRFLSPDPLLASATWDQAYNRYAYAANNPLKYTDPTGYLLNWEGCGSGTLQDENGNTYYEGPLPCPHSADAQAGAEMNAMMEESRRQDEITAARLAAEGNDKDGQASGAQVAAGNEVTCSSRGVTCVDPATRTGILALKDEAARAFFRSTVPVPLEGATLSIRAATRYTGREIVGFLDLAMKGGRPSFGLDTKVGTRGYLQAEKSKGDQMDLSAYSYKSGKTAAIVHSHTDGPRGSVGGGEGISTDDRATAHFFGASIYALTPRGDVWLYQPGKDGAGMLYNLGGL